MKIDRIKVSGFIIFSLIFSSVLINCSGQNYEERKRQTLAYHGQKVLLETLPDSLNKYPLSKFTEKNAWTKAIVNELIKIN